MRQWIQSKSKTRKPAPTIAGTGFPLQTVPLTGEALAGGILFLGGRDEVPVRRSGVKSMEGLQASHTIMPKPNIHVVPHDAGWAWRREGTQRVSGTADTQADAERAARKAAQRDGVELVVHRRDGRIRDKDSHGHDPYPPEG